MSILSKSIDIKEQFKNYLKVKDSQLYVGSLEISELVKKYDLPLHINFSGLLKNNIDAFKNVFKKQYNNGQIRFAAKALTHEKIFNVIKEKDIGVDIASENELRCAVDSGLALSKIDVNGNAKENSLIQYAVNHDMLIIVDNWEELKLISELSHSANKCTKILLRLSGFSVKAATSENILTAATWSKFGIPIEEIYLSLSEVINNSSVDLLGFHTHIGSQITDINIFLSVLSQMLSLSIYLNKSNGKCRVINIGGGFPVSYISAERWDEVKFKIKQGYEAALENDHSKHYVWGGGVGNFEAEPDGKIGFEKWSGDAYYSELTKDQMLSEILSGKVIIDGKERKVLDVLNELNQPEFVIEPGRALIDDTGITISKVSFARKICFGHNLLTLEMGVASLCDSLIGLPIKSWSAFPMHNDVNWSTYEAFIAGNLCFSADILSRIKIPFPFKVKRGDLAIIFETGGYGPQFLAANANSFPRPNRLFFDDDEFNYLKHRDLYKEIFY